MDGILYPSRIKNMNMFGFDHEIQMRIQQFSRQHMARQ